MLFTLTPTAPADGYGEALLSLADAKAHCRVLADDEDDLIGALRDAAIDMVEQYCGLRLAPCTGLIAKFADFGPGMRMGVGPAGSVVVTAISYIDSTGAAVALNAGAWRVGVDGAILPAIGTSWPVAGGPVTVMFNTGFPVGAAPPVLITAAKMFLAHLYVNREAVITGMISGEIPLGFTMLCNRHRMPVI